MAKRVFHDETRCNGCRDCEAECRQVHGLRPWVSLLRVVKGSSSSPDGRITEVWVRVSCRHCDQPDCIAACPAGAIQKRADGIVWIDAARCDGCGDCVPACDVRAIRIDLVTRKAIKCDLCKDRVDQGLLPACVVKCKAKALFFGTEEEREALLRERDIQPATL